MKSIKRLGLAVLTVAAFAVMPGMASAAGGIVADEYDAGLVASGKGELLATTGGSGSSYCNFGESLKGQISGPSAAYALSGTGAKCSNSYGTVPVDMNNCKLEFDPASQSMAVGPPTCSSIETRVGFCNIDILPQTGLAATQANQEGEIDTATISIEAINAKYEIKETVGACWKGVYSNLSLDGDFDLAGYEAVEESLGPQVDIKVVTDGLLPVGVFTSGGKYDAQAYPVSYRATPVSAEKLKLIGLAVGNVTCQEGGAGKLEAASSTLGFNEFSGCTFGGQAATVVPNSCSYQFTTQVSVTCTKEGDKIQLVTALCTITIAPQSFTGSTFTPSNAGEGFDATVGLSSAATGIKTGKERTSPSQPVNGCLTFPKEGSGTFTADVSLSGSYAG